MDFLLSKLLWIVVNPANIIVALLIGGVVGWRWFRAARHAVRLAAVLLIVAAVLPTGRWLATPLEARFPANPPLPTAIDGIIVLGGMVEPYSSRVHGQPALNHAAERLRAFADLSRRFPDARLVFTGGSGTLMHRDLSEADVALTALSMMAVNPARVIFENKSSNTYENAVFSKRLVGPGAGETWVLVTSAIHMPRSVGIFRRAGWPVLPFPVDFRADEAGDFDASRRLERFVAVTREWVGLAAYRLMGRTDAWFPAPAH